MKKPNIGHKDYDSSLLFDALKNRFRLNSDAELADFLEVDRSLISHIRNRQQLLSPGLLIRMQDITGIDLKELRAFMGDHRTHFLISKKYQ